MIKRIPSYSPIKGFIIRCNGINKVKCCHLPVYEKGGHNESVTNYYMHYNHKGTWLRGTWYKSKKRAKKAHNRFIKSEISDLQFEIARLEDKML